ncbi:hemicentin-2-like [Ostrea edulis]|uniref:hemicentin-2-like n=1 Tax=Ostrea edulis TaxID=37623 RepID=UPI0024AF11B0|nr:hemicentin-2-like [Ostrea edulis]
MERLEIFKKSSPSPVLTIVVIPLVDQTVFVCQDITLTPQSPATVREGQALELTCQSGQTSGLYKFYYINSEGNNIEYANGGGSFAVKPCDNKTNDAVIECDFGTPWKFKLTLLNPVHNQTIYCQRSFQGRDVSISTTIFVQVPVTSVTLSPSPSVEVIEGTSFTFSCVSKAARPAANITWYRDDMVVSGSSSSTSTNNLLYDVTSNLTSSYNRTDNGKRIYCTAVNINGDTPKQSSKPQLNVIYAPPAAPQLTAVGSTSVNEGQSITLRCTLSTLGNPHITWSWVCGDDNLTTGVTNTGTQSVLTLTVNRKYNQRTCQCRATSPSLSLSYDRTSGTQTITVYYAPPAAPQLTAVGSMSVNEGQSITLRCTLSTLGNPSITWSWVCGDDTLTTGMTNTGTQSELTLTANRKYNQRTCQCKATSPSLSYDRTSGTQTITVNYAPPAAPQLTAVGSTSVNEGQSITLRCTLSTLGNPHITWSWVCEDDTLTTGVTNTGTQSELTLTANRKYNQRTCQCRATSPRPSLSYNRASRTHTITVYYSNVITSNISERYVTSEHGRLQIKCDVDGNPLSTITWLFVQNNTAVKNESNVSSSSLEISSANCLDHGNYKVTADNGKGPAAVRIIHVAVKCNPRLYNMDSQTPADKLGIGNNESLQILVRMLLYPQATLTNWTFLGKNNESKIIQNNINGYNITDSKEENKQNISLYKRSVKTEDFGEYTLMVLNGVGNFTRIYHVDAARPPLKPTNLTLECGTSVKLSWISNFNGGDSQTFKISYSTAEDSSYKELEIISDKGYDRLHSYTPSIGLRGTVWFTVTASNMFGNSTSDYVHCIVKVPAEDTSSVAALAGGAAAGGISLAVVVIVIVIFVRRYSKHEKQTSKTQRFRDDDGNESADDDGLKVNALYVSADIVNDDKPGPSETAVYAEVNKKIPESDSNANVYAEVKKTGKKAGEDKATNGAVKHKKGFLKKEEKTKQKKGKKQKLKQEVPDVYENSEDIAMKQRGDDVYSNTGENRPPKQEQRGYKNQDGLLYVEVQFDAKADNRKSVIHGEEEKTDYATVEFPFPPSSQKTAEGGKKEK